MHRTRLWSRPWPRAIHVASWVDCAQSEPDAGSMLRRRGCGGVEVPVRNFVGTIVAVVAVEADALVPLVVLRRLLRD